MPISTVWEAVVQGPQWETQREASERQCEALPAVSCQRHSPGLLLQSCYSLGEGVEWKEIDPPPTFPQGLRHAHRPAGDSVVCKQLISSDFSGHHVVS